MENKEDNSVESILDDIERITNEGARLSRKAKHYYYNANRLYETAKYVFGEKYGEDSKIIEEMRNVDYALFTRYRKKWIIIAVVTLIILIFL